MFETKLAQAEALSSDKSCGRRRKFSTPNSNITPDGYYSCVLPMNRTVFFRKSETAPWAPAVRCCHICALELCGDEGDSRDQAILLGA